ncbi:hypothetical protein [Acidiphilium acidophilum]|uniref:hypothetical protein n=1 Tax=Acidiphilium acidophilum TaxID=76588 RepID=UPI002E8E68F6|nr:hypothetical protein [Acidiphilium acidophilum]
MRFNSCQPHAFSTTFCLAVQKLAKFCNFFARVKGKVSKLGLIGTTDHRATRKQRRRHLAQIGDSAFMDFAPLAETLPQQHGRRRSAIPNHIDEHDGRESQIESRRKSRLWTQSSKKKLTLSDDFQGFHVILK